MPLHHHLTLFRADGCSPLMLENIPMNLPTTRRKYSVCSIRNRAIPLCGRSDDDDLFSSWFIFSMATNKAANLLKTKREMKTRSHQPWRSQLWMEGSKVETPIFFAERLLDYLENVLCCITLWSEAWKTHVSIASFVLAWIVVVIILVHVTLPASTVAPALSSSSMNDWVLLAIRFVLPGPAKGEEIKGDSLEEWMCARVTRLLLLCR
jgi:hypothetical protein